MKENITPSWSHTRQNTSRLVLSLISGCRPTKNFQAVTISDHNELKSMPKIHLSLSKKVLQDEKHAQKSTACSGKTCDRGHSISWQQLPEQDIEACEQKQCCGPNCHHLSISFLHAKITGFPGRYALHSKHYWSLPISGLVKTNNWAILRTSLLSD